MSGEMLISVRSAELCSVPNFIQSLAINKIDVTNNNRYQEVNYSTDCMKLVIRPKLFIIYTK